MWKLERCTDERLLELYADTYNAFGTARVELGFLRGCEVFVLRDLQTGRFGGGFVLRKDLPFRCIEGVCSQRVRRELWHRSSGAIEVTCLWIDPALKSFRSRAHLMVGVLREARARKARCIWGVTTRDAIWRKSYRLLGARELYGGATQLGTGPAVWGRVFELDLGGIVLRSPIYFLAKFFFSIAKISKKVIKGVTYDPIF